MINLSANSLDSWIDAGIENTDTFLMVNSCGYQKFVTKDYAVSRAKGRVDFLLIYLIDGKGHYDFPSGETEIMKGNIVVFRPGEPQFYQYLFRDGAELFWIHFTGSDAPNILSELSLLDSRAIYVGTDSDSMELIRKMIHELNLKKPSYQYLVSSYLLQLFSRLSRLSKAGREASRFDDIHQIVSLMHADYNRSYTIDDFAKRCNLSQSRFVHKFKSSTGKTPMQYIMNIRINKAKDLLSYSNLNISEVSLMIGYDNPLYFSRIFKRETGISPSEFKKAMS